jgi:hypothetical protein
LAAEIGKSNSIGCSYIKLEVNKTNGKDEHISRVKSFGDEAVLRVGCDKANVQNTLYDN